MGRSAGYVSPATRVRSLRRAIQYFRLKGMANRRQTPELFQVRCASVDICPPSLSPMLTISVLPSISIPPNPTTNEPSFSRQPAVPLPSSNPIKSNYLTLEDAKQQMRDFNRRTKPPLAPDPGLKCNECDKTFDTRDDMKWHQENKFGREDCIILQKMMLSNYLCKPVI